MRVFFDTSVLVPALVDQLSNHESFFAVFHSYTSGIIYDALYVEAAKKASCSRIYTYNFDHFEAPAQEKISVSSP